MGVITLGVATLPLVIANPNRKTLSITNTHAANIVYISDKGTVTADNVKWILYPYETLIFDTERDKPERPYYGLASAANTDVVVGWQNAKEVY